MLENLPDWAQQALTPIMAYVPPTAAALGIAIAGWVVALIVRRALFGALKRLALAHKAARLVGLEAPQGDRVERGLARVGYYGILGLTAVVLFDYLNLDLVTQPIVSALEGVAGGVPNLLKATLIAGAGFLTASLLRALTTRVLDRTGLVDRIAKLSLEPEEADGAAIRRKDGSKLAGQLVFWLVLGLTAIPVLEALRVGLLAEPLSAALQSVSTYVPRLLGAGVLLLVGYALGRAARALLSAVVGGLKLETRLKGWGLDPLLGSLNIGRMLGSVAMAFIFLHFAISAVGRLGIPEVSEPLGLVLTQFYDYLPKLLVGGLLLVVAMAVSRLVSRAAASLLAAMGLNRVLEQIGLGGQVSAEARAEETLSAKALRSGAVGPSVAQRLLSEGSTSSRTPAGVAGLVLGAVVFLLFAQQVLQTLELDTLSVMLQSLLSYLPNVFVALCVLAAGAWAGRWSKSRIETLTAHSQDPMMRALGVIARVAVITVAAMVALEQLGVAERLIAIAFTAVLGATALACALAFGLGGRDAAGRLLDSQLRKRPNRGGLRPSQSPTAAE